MFKGSTWHWVQINCPLNPGSYHTVTFFKSTLQPSRAPQIIAVQRGLPSCLVCLCQLTELTIWVSSRYLGKWYWSKLVLTGCYSRHKVVLVENTDDDTSESTYNLTVVAGIDHSLPFPKQQLSRQRRKSPGSQRSSLPRRCITVVTSCPQHTLWVSSCTKLS